MALKVLPSGAVPSQQHVISGGLGAFLIIVPSLIILIIFREFVYYPTLFDALVLYVSIQCSTNTARYSKVMKALKSNKKALAKELLQPMVLRETAMLSEIGVSKAAIESITLRYHYQIGVTVFWFIAIGPFAALTYRACYELHQSWNPKIEKYRLFGMVTAKACSFFQWLPVRVLAFLVVLGTKGFNIITYIKNYNIAKSFAETKGAILIRATHFALNANLSGALYYQGKKYRRPKYIGRGEPKASFMPNAIAVLNRATVLYVLVLLLMCIMLDILTKLL